MKKNEATIIKLEAALERILLSETIRIPPSRKLSVRAVEEEAGLGNGSCYYYTDIIEKIKKAKYQIEDPTRNTENMACLQIQKIRKAKNNEKRIKQKYKDENKELKQRIEDMAAEHHQFAHALRLAYKRIQDLEQELEKTQQDLIASNRKKIRPIRS
ncbi:hypothetical protein HWA77_20835 [Photobacterium damselae subsp. damselae]|uniref:Uncharacterized protein n=1 Tax=Photobacterium damselae subsp. damselae TaxID=85581 RepID=A0A850R6Z2_PHODD|nr:hypothetical protein [Photobacterium damselae subsp. damselae]